LVVWDRRRGLALYIDAPAIIQGKFSLPDGQVRPLDFVRGHVYCQPTVQKDIPSRLSDMKEE
jgi:hypothetical protein